MEPSFEASCLAEKVCNWNGALNETECTDPSLSSHVCVICENEEECIEGMALQRTPMVVSNSFDQFRALPPRTNAKT